MLHHETPDFIAPNLWRPKHSTDLNPLRLQDLGCHAASCLPETNP